MITITVTGYNAQPVAHPLSANFDEAGGTIGRAPDNTLVLLDPERKISRTHATVAYRDGTYVLCDHGSVVPVVLNQQPLGKGTESPLKGGDEIRIGAYILEVAADATANRATPSVATLPAAPPPVVVADAADAATATTAMTEPVLSWASDPGAAPGEGITTIILPASENEGAAPADADSAPPASALPPSEPARESAALVADASPATAPTEPAREPGVTVDATAPVANEELLRALLAGAGLRDVEIPGGLTPQLMHQLGQLLHEATRGLLDLLAARASTKREVRADMTVIVAADNNPLKFAPNMEAALTHLLVPRGRGFMPPPRAVADAYDDLRNHQLGFMAGMRSALAVVLARFDPQELEKRLAEHSMVDSFLPTNRKAKLWDLFGQVYGEISKEAASDFRSLLGQEFLRTYREHVAKLPGAGDRAAGR
jgi:FHA domain-containing protein/type VI secretion system protein